MPTIKTYERFLGAQEFRARGANDPNRLEGDHASYPVHVGNWIIDAGAELEAVFRAEHRPGEQWRWLLRARFSVTIEGAGEVVCSCVERDAVAGDDEVGHVVVTSTDLEGEALALHDRSFDADRQIVFRVVARSGTRHQFHGVAVTYTAGNAPS